MKFKRLISLSLTAALFLTSCSASDPVIKDSILDNSSSQQSETVSAQNSDSSAPTQSQQSDPPSADPTDTDNGSLTTSQTQEFLGYTIGIPDELPTEYNGEELSFTVEVLNSSAEHDQAVLIFVNGEINEYSTDQSDEKKTFHILHVPEEGYASIKIYFTPANCKKGETALINISYMLNPDYMLTDTSSVSFGHNHELSSFSPFEIAINEDTPVTEEHSLFTTFEKVELTEEFKEKYSPRGEMDIDSPHFVFYMDEGEHFFTADDKLEVEMSAYGSYDASEDFDATRRYLVGIYINNELQQAFGDDYYALFELDKDHTTSCTVTIDTSQLTGLNSIYIIAVPYDHSAVDLKVEAHKSSTQLLLIEN